MYGPHSWKCSQSNSSIRPHDHLLTGAVRLVDGFDEAKFVVLIHAYRRTLSNESSFDTWLLDDVLGFLATSTRERWPTEVFDRDCNFSKLDDALEGCEPAKPRACNGWANHRVVNTNGCSTSTVPPSFGLGNVQRPIAMSRHCSTLASSTIEVLTLA